MSLASAFRASALPVLSARIKGSRRGGRASRFARSGFAESTLAELAWQRTRSAATRWAWAGALLGALGGLIAFAPAAWVASAVSQATGGRLLLTEARGTAWRGSALPVLTGGAGSRDAMALPDRLEWQLSVRGINTLELALRQACCVVGQPRLRVQAGLNQAKVNVLPDAQASDGAVLQWPAAVLTGLGTPWNTLQLGGSVKLTARDLQIERVQGRLRVAGFAQLDLQDTRSRLATLDTLGSYRLNLQGDAAQGDAQLNLSTVEGALQLSGQGSWTAAGARFRGEAQAAPGNETALNNLLNIIGRRQGARSVISIG
jgi:general secretion pathway protein N